MARNVGFVLPRLRSRRASAMRKQVGTRPEGSRLAIGESADAGAGREVRKMTSVGLIGCDWIANGASGQTSELFDLEKCRETVGSEGLGVEKESQRPVSTVHLEIVVGGVASSVAVSWSKIESSSPNESSGSSDGVGCPPISPPSDDDCRSMTCFDLAPGEFKFRSDASCSGSGWKDGGISNADSIVVDSPTSSRE